MMMVMTFLELTTLIFSVLVFFAFYFSYCYFFSPSFLLWKFGACGSYCLLVVLHNVGYAVASRRGQVFVEIVLALLVLPWRKYWK